MARVYLSKSQISEHQGLDEVLVSLVEREAAKLEKQSSFRSLYDIDILGITVYYQKNWHYEGGSKET